MLHSVYLSARLSLPVTLVTFELTIFCYFSLRYFCYIIFCLIYFYSCKKVGGGGAKAPPAPPPARSLTYVVQTPRVERRIFLEQIRPTVAPEPHEGDQPLM